MCWCVLRNFCTKKTSLWSGPASLQVRDFSYWFISSFSCFVRIIWRVWKYCPLTHIIVYPMHSYLPYIYIVRYSKPFRNYGGLSRAECHWFSPPVVCPIFPLLHCWWCRRDGHDRTGKIIFIVVLQFVSPHPVEHKRTHLGFSILPVHINCLHPSYRVARCLRRLRLLVMKRSSDMVSPLPAVCCCIC